MESSFSYAKMSTNPLRKAAHALKAGEEERKAEFEAQTMRGALPCWTEDRYLTCDKVALHYGKRCVLWDDDGSGFCLWLNWDWAANCPARIDPNDPRSNQPGWYQNISSVLQPPLLDTSLADDALASWIDENTMRCHKNLLDRRQTVRRRDTKSPSDAAASESSGLWVLDDPYQEKLDALNVMQG